MSTNAQTAGDDERGDEVAPPMVRDFLTYRLSRVQAKLNRQASRVLRAHSTLSLTQWRALAMMGERSASTLSDIVSMTKLDKGQLSRALKGLIEAGFVETQASGRDLRRHRIALTELGRAEFARLLPVMRSRQSHLGGRLTAAERAALLAALEKIERAAERIDFP